MSSIITGRDNSTGAPPDSWSADYRLDWAKEALAEADSWLRNQPLFDRIAKTRQMLLSIVTTDRGALGLSDTQCNHLLRIFNIGTADMHDVRPFWRYETSNRANELMVRNLGNLTTSWWQRSMADRQLGLTIKQAWISATGVSDLQWDRDTGDFAMLARNPLDVKPLRSTDLSTYQKCLAVISSREMTVNSVRSMFPKYARYIEKDRDASVTGLSAKTSYVPTGSVGEAAAMQEGIPDSKIGPLPVVDLFYMYIDDNSRNQSSDTILMGDWDRDPKGALRGLNHWSYEVAPKEERYPFKRLIIFTRRCILYDGPSPYWHGMFPFAKLTPNPFPDLWFGLSPLWPCLPLQESLNKLYRAFDDQIQVFLKPPVSGDRRSLSPGEMANLDPRKPGQRWLRNPGHAEMKRVEIPQMDPFAVEYEKMIRERMDELAGIRNLTSILGLNQMPEGETIDKLLQAMTPEARERSRNLETYQTEIGTMMAYNVSEFYGERRVFEILGEDGLTRELYDFDPGTLVPAYTDGSFAPDGLEGKAMFDPRTGVIVNTAPAPLDVRPRWVRARENMRKYRFRVEPASMMESASASRKMMMLMLQSKNTIPRYDLYEALDLEGRGPKPKGTIEERLRKQMADDAVAQAQAQAQAQAAAMVGNPAMLAQLLTGGAGGPTPDNGNGSGNGSGGGGESNVKPPGAPPEGRPSTFQKPPHREGDKISTS